MAADQKSIVGNAPCQFSHGHLKISGTSPESALILDGSATMRDVASAMARSGHQCVLIRDSFGQLVGPVRMSDIENIPWQAGLECLSAEAVITTRLLPPPRSGGSIRRVSPGETIPCTPVMEGDELVGIMTPDDVFLSLTRMEPMIRAATTDFVTGLANRRMFHQRLFEEWNRSTRSGEALAVLLLDVDRFKEINDMHGHPVGDSVLAAVATSLQQALRGSDVVARFGGDEFAVLCPRCGFESLPLPVRRIIRAVRHIAVQTPESTVDITVSIGMVAASGDIESTTPQSVIDAADRCLYLSKSAGRNRATLGHLQLPGPLSMVPFNECEAAPCEPA